MKQRVISAIVALAIVIPLIYLGGIYFDILMYAVAILSLRELLNVRKKIPIYIKYASYFLLVIMLLNDFTLISVNYFIETKLILFLLLCLMLPLIIYHDNEKYNIDDSFYVFGSLILLSTVFSEMRVIRDEGLLLIIYILIIPFMTDMFAFFGGCKFGKHKLIPSVSPKKSIEGLIIGTLSGVIVGSLFHIFLIHNMSPLLTVLLTLFLSLMGQFGDLIFSSIKRYFNTKDFSNIMPGHGGVLDRIDSIIFVVLAYAYIIDLL